MDDPTGSIGPWNWAKTSWAPPEQVSNVFRAGGIKLDLRISYPHPHSEEET